MADVTCIGVIVADVVGKPIESFPERGKLALVERMELHPGGCAANTGLTLAKLGIPTAIIGKVGQDGFGDFMVDCFKRAGMNVEGVARDKINATSATMVLGHGDGERSFLHYSGANASLRADDIDFEIVRNSKIVHVAGTFLLSDFDGEPTAQFLQKAQNTGIITTLDTAWDARGFWMQKMRPCLPYLDYFLPSYEEARMLADGREDPEEIARVFLDLGAKVVALKLGERGCYVRSQSGETITLPVLPVTAVDALGAGDSFVAGFLAGVVRGWELERCARFANAVGASCVMAVGATTGIRTFDETLQLMEQYPVSRTTK